MRITVQSGHCLFESGEATLVRILDSGERELVLARWDQPNVFVAPELPAGRYDVSFFTCSVRHLPSGQAGTLSTVLPFHLAITDAEIEQGTIALPIPGKTLLKLTALKDGTPVPNANIMVAGEVVTLETRTDGGGSLVLLEDPSDLLAVDLESGMTAAGVLYGPSGEVEWMAR